MDERCICPDCGRPHRKRKTVDTVARAKGAAESRWNRKPRITNGRVDTAISPIQQDDIKNQRTVDAVNHEMLTNMAQRAGRENGLPSEPTLPVVKGEAVGRNLAKPKAGSSPAPATTESDKDRVQREYIERMEGKRK